MERDPLITAGLYSLLARIGLDADMGIGFVAGKSGDFIHAIDELMKAKPSPSPAPSSRFAPEPPRAAGSDYPISAEDRRGPSRVPAPSREVHPAPAGAGAPAALSPGYVSLVPYVQPPGNPEKEALLADLRRESATCTLCGLCERRNSVVWGEGDLDADIMFIGEGPGKDEDVEGRPFVGRAGRLLTDIIEKGMQRLRTSVYIANVVKCRPPGNRDPRPDEVSACSRYLNKQIEVVNPAVIVALGMVAGRALLDLPPEASGLRNQWLLHKNIPMRVIYHPSYLLRQRQSDSHRTRADKATWEDIQEIMQKTAELRGNTGA